MPSGLCVTSFFAFLSASVGREATLSILIDRYTSQTTFMPLTLVPVHRLEVLSTRDAQRLDVSGPPRALSAMAARDTILITFALHRNQTPRRLSNFTIQL